MRAKQKPKFLFGKLLKNDLLQTGRVLIPFIGGAVAVGAAVSIYSTLRLDSLGSFTAAVLLNLLIMILGFFSEMLSVVFVLQQTNKSFFSPQGYLTFSLPVSSESLLLSRFLTNVIWILLGVGTAAGSSVAAMSNFRRLFLNMSAGMIEKLGDSMGNIPDVSQFFNFASFGEVLRFGGIFLFMIFAFAILVMMTVIFVITVSHVRPFQNLAGLWMLIFSAASAAAFITVIRLVSKYAALKVQMQLFTMAVAEEYNQAVEINLTSMFVAVGLSVGLFFLTNFLLKRKISLK